MTINLTAAATIKLIDDVSAPAHKVAAALKEAEARAKAFAAELNGTGLSNKFAQGLARMGVSAKEIEKIAAAFKDYTKAQGFAANSADWTKTQVANVRAWEATTTTALRNIMREQNALAEAERRAAMEAKNQASEQAAAARAAQRAAESEQRAVQRTTAAEIRDRQRLKREWLGGDRTLAGSLGAAAMGGVLVEAAKKAAESGAELEQLQFRIRTAGGAGEAAAADKLASDFAARYPNLTKASLLDTYGELRPNAVNQDGTINPDRAAANLATAARGQTAALTLGVPMTPHDMQNLLKSMELTGRAGDPTAFGKIIDAYLKGKQMYGTAISSESLLTFVQNAKSANFGLSDSVLYGSLWARLAEGNAARLGNEFSQTIATLVGGHMTKQGAEWLVSHGLINKDQIRNGKGGKFYIEGPIKDATMLSSDPTTWADSVLLPSIKNSGVLDEAKVQARMKLMGEEEKKRTGVAPNEEALRERAQAGLISDDLYKSGWRGTVVDQLAHAIVNALLINRDTAAMNKLPGSEVAADIGQNPIASFNELTSAVSNFGAVLASPALAKAGPVMDTIAKGVASVSASFSDFSKAHPDLAAWIGGGAVVGGVAGGGALAYGALSGLINGFGLKTSADLLDKSAFALDEAAAKLSASSTLKPSEPLPVPEGEPKPGSPSAPEAISKPGAPPEPAAVPRFAPGEALRGSLISALVYEEGKRLIDAAFPLTKEQQEHLDNIDPLNFLLRQTAAQIKPGAAQPPPIVSPPSPVTPQSVPTPPGLDQLTNLQAAQQVDASAIDQAAQKADEAKTKVEALNMEAAPRIDTSSIDAAIEKALRLQAILREADERAQSAAAPPAPAAGSQSASSTPVAESQTTAAPPMAESAAPPSPVTAQRPPTPPGLDELVKLQATPQVDSSQIDQAAQKADEAKTKVEALNTEVSPRVDTSSIDAAIEKALRLQAILRSAGDVGGASGGASSYRASQGASFTSRGAR